MAYSFSIPQLLDLIVAVEGGYTNHPSDLGGPTIWGITERIARNAGYTKPMHVMSRNEAKEIYLKHYIQNPGFDRIHQLDASIGSEVIDTGVNMGIGMSGMFLQKSLNALNQRGKHYPDLKVDGDCGPRTAATLKSYLEKRGKPGVVVLLRALNSLQGARYLEISEKREENEDFTFGWFLNRVEL